AVWDLRRSRRNLDPHFRARRGGRIVGFGAGTVVPVRLRLLVHDDRRWLHDDLRRVVVGRIVIRRGKPPPTPPQKKGDDAEAAAPKKGGGNPAPLRQGCF